MKTVHSEIRFGKNLNNVIYTDEPGVCFSRGTRADALDWACETPGRILYMEGDLDNYAFLQSATQGRPVRVVDVNGATIQGMGADPVSLRVDAIEARLARLEA